MYGEVMSHLRDPRELLADGTPPPTIFHDPVRRLAGGSPVERMMFLDLVGFLPDDILVKVDRATMAVSLESRAPLLDHTVAEFAWRVPLHLKRRDGRGKWLLREVLRRYVPDSIVDRPKMGFGVPVREWLAGPLREWSRDILTPARLRRDGFFRPEAVGRLWERQQAGESRREDVLWSLVMFHAWLDEQ
jgi:asparagine synthase (glutamine-hydrolysing)